MYLSKILNINQGGVKHLACSSVFTIVCVGFFVLAYAQITKQDKFHDLTETVLQALKKKLLSKNLEVRDTIFIKYDYNRESCWIFSMDHTF